MIARIWTGQVPQAKTAEYVRLMQERAVPDYQATEGCLGAWCLYREEGGTTTVTMLSFWASQGSIEAFAGEDITRARYYDFDPDYLLSMPETVTHYDVAPSLERS